MTPSRPPPKKPRWSWRSRALRGLVFQVAAIAAVALGVWLLAHAVGENMRSRGIHGGFDFLAAPAGFDIGESPVPFDAASPYWRAFVAGLANTVRVAVSATVLTMILGTLVGVGRLSRNALVRGLCQLYVECFRNVPLLLQLLMWYLLLTQLLPPSFDAWQVGPVFVSKGGFNAPLPVWAPGHAAMAVGLLAGIALAVASRRRAVRRFEEDGVVRDGIWMPVAIACAGAAGGWLLGGAPSAFALPYQGEHAIEGGAALTPEFVALLVGLTLYTAAFVAEIVRAGIRSVPAGQAEAAAALGLDRGKAMRLVLLPQALRLIVPPLGTQVLNLTKGSSLAVAIGYPDLVSVANTSLNQTGRAVECIAIVMAVYLCTSLGTSALMNWYNARVALLSR